MYFHANFKHGDNTINLTYMPRKFKTTLNCNITSAYHQYTIYDYSLYSEFWKLHNSRSITHFFSMLLTSTVLHIPISMGIDNGMGRRLCKWEMISVAWCLCGVMLSSHTGDLGLQLVFCTHFLETQIEREYLPINCYLFANKLDESRRNVKNRKLIA